MKVVQFQTEVHEDKWKNIENLAALLRGLEGRNIDLVTLPEMFVCPYQTDKFPACAEEEGGPLWRACADLAKSGQLHLAAGSMPEIDREGRIYNTAYVFDPQGRQIAKHRKAHLFDINVPGGQYFRESDTLSPGGSVTVFQTSFGLVGLCICYDFRFPELARLMALQGAEIILAPGAFNMTTGPAHWELTFRARALDNQVFTLGTAPARDLAASYTSWGHTIAVDPWGRVLGQLDEKPGALVQELDLHLVRQIREQLPLLAHRRTDIYEVREAGRDA